MSEQAAAAFLNTINEDPVLQDEFRKAMPTEGASGTAIVQFAARHGFEFTERELQARIVAAANRALSDSELDAVAGGIAVAPSSGSYSIGGLTYHVDRT